MRYTLTAIAILITTMAFGQRQYIANMEIAPDSNAAWTIYTDTNGVQQYFKFDSILYDIFQIDTLGGDNNYLNSATFGTGTGTLTLGRLGLADITVSLDGRYETDNNYATGHTFNTSTGLFTTTRSGLADITVNLDGRYATDNNYLTGLSFNTSTGVLTGTRQGLSNVTEDLDGRYLTLAAFNVGSVTGGVRFSVSPTSGTYDNFELYEGTNVTFNRSANDVTINASGDGNNFATGHSFNTSTGVFTTTRDGLSDISEDLDGRYIQPANLGGGFRTAIDISGLNATVRQQYTVNTGVTSNITVTESDIYTQISTSGSVTATIPFDTETGAVFYFALNLSGGSGSVTIDPSGATTINGSSSQTYSVGAGVFQMVFVIYDGSGYRAHRID